MERVDLKQLNSEVAIKGYTEGVILQHGEVTGHHHLLQTKGAVIDYADDLKDYRGDDVSPDKFSLTEEGVVTHHEHWTHVVPKDVVIVKSIQQAYNPWLRSNMPVRD